MDAAVRNLVRERAEDRCEYCRLPQAGDELTFHVEHIIASQHQQSDDPSNLALACNKCNLFKSSRIQFVDRESGAEVRLFNPRIDLWGECFRVDAETGTIVGQNPTGRATVDCLSMNTKSQLAARIDWIHLGLFP